ncbi:hypothetical protein [uncultured Ruminococcus sp.]|nr:hypothetical protein [uncultured Ruminococcus sp.]
MQIVTKVELLQKCWIYTKRCDILLDKERDDMKRAIYISILCTVMLTACGNVSESTKRAETSDVSQTTTTLTTSAATAKEEKDTSEAATTTFKTSSQTVSETSKPTDITVTTTKKSDPSGYSGNSSQGQNNSAQNNNGQENNYQPVQNDPQPDNSPSDNNRSNNGAEQNNRPSDNKPQNNDPTPPTTTAKPQITVPQTEPPEVVIEDTTNLQSVLNYVNSLGRTTDEYYNIGAGLSHDGSDYGKAEAVYNWIRDNVSGNCQVFSVATMYACKGIGLECRYAFFSSDDWYGHMANLVNVSGAWYVFDTQGGRFLKSDKYGDITQIFDENDNTIELSVSESAY